MKRYALFGEPGPPVVIVDGEPEQPFEQPENSFANFKGSSDISSELYKKAANFKWRSVIDTHTGEEAAGPTAPPPTI